MDSIRPSHLLKGLIFQLNGSWDHQFEVHKLLLPYEENRTKRPMRFEVLSMALRSRGAFS
jgi:hypothetical protein